MTADRPTMASDRLRYEPLQLSHAAELAAALGDPRVSTYFHAPEPSTPATVAKRIARVLAGPPLDDVPQTWLNFVVAPLAGGPLIGRIEATVVAKHATEEVVAKHARNKLVAEHARIKLVAEHAGVKVTAARAEVAYLFDPRVWGNGYASEAVGWLHEHCRQSHGISQFWATVTPANVRSVRVLLRLGYRRVNEADAPHLFSYDAGDLVFRRDASARGS